MVKILKQLLSLFTKGKGSQKVNEKSCNCEHGCKKEKTTVLQKGTYARQLLANPLFGIMFDDLKTDALEQWEQSPARDVDGREMLWTYTKILQQVKAKMDGYIAEAAIETENEKRKQESQPTL